MAARKNLEHDEYTKEKIKGSQLVNLLIEHAITGSYNGQPVDQSRIAAARAALPFLRPTLQAVESRQADPFEGMTQEQLLEQVRALISSRPELLAGVKHLVEPVKPVQDEPKQANGA